MLLFSKIAVNLVPCLLDYTSISGLGLIVLPNSAIYLESGLLSSKSKICPLSYCCLFLVLNVGRLDGWNLFESAHPKGLPCNGVASCAY